MVYKKQGDALTLESALFSEGRLIPMTNYIEPQYFLTDHLGSVRMVLNGARNVIERNNYYAFGQRWEDQNQLISDNRYTYNGKEDQGFLKLPYICFGARQFDPLTGRWFNPDPLAAMYYSTTPYGYCVNNPINAIDTDGRLIVFVGGFEPNRTFTSISHMIGIMAMPNNLLSMGAKKQMAKAVATPDRGFTSGDNYGWGEMDDLYMDTFDDKNALYTQGRHFGEGSASDRYAMGTEAGKRLAEQIARGEVSLADGETIKLVGHSQGAAYAAGLAQGLIAAGYGYLIQTVDYIAAHQPGGFSHPKGVLGRQFGSTKDIFSQRGNKKIENIKDQDFHTSKFGVTGHSITGQDINDFMQRCIANGVPITIK